MKRLICWNPCNDDGQKCVSHGLSKILNLEGDELEFIFDYQSFKQKTENTLWKNYDSIIMLSELEWNNAAYSKLYGIELIKDDVRLKEINLPVLFLSFLSREQILKHDDSKQIISTYALGNHFIQLPFFASDKDIELFKAMQPVPSEEMEDNLNFVAFDKIVSTIRHDVNKNNIEGCKKRLKNIVKKRGLRDKFEVKIDECSTVVEVKNICDEIEPKVKSKGSDMSTVESDSEYKVLLLEDEDIEDIDALIKEAKVSKLTITHCRKTTEAYKIIEEDKNNEFLVILVDFRIWDNPDTDFAHKIMTEKQGYRFIDDVVKLGRRYTFVSFSELPRAFRLRIASTSNTRVIPKEKNLSLSSKEQRKVLLNDIIHLAEETKDSLALNASDKEVFVRFYNTAASMKSWEDNKKYIDDKSLEYINLFIETFDTDKNLIFEENNSFWTKFNIEYKFNFQTKLQKSDDEIISDFFYKLYEDEEITSFSGEDATLKSLVSKTLTKSYPKEIEKIINIVCENQRKYGTKDQKRSFEKNVIPYMQQDIKTLILLDCKKINYKEPDYLEDIPKFVNQLIIRRLGMYIAYWIKNNQGLLQGAQYSTMQSLNSFLSQGFIPATPTPGERKRNSGRKTTNQDLWFSPRKNKGVSSVKEFNDIGMTIEEEKFFHERYSNLYEEWKNKGKS